jgi:PAS domain S-box-containing protein
VGIGRVAGRNFLEVNDHLCQILGYAREEIIDHSSRMLYLSQEEFEAVGKDLYEQIRTQGVGTVETRWRRKDGMILPVLINGSSLNPEIPDEGATLTILDLSSRKRAIEQAQASEARYRQLFDTMAEGVVYQNADGEIISANPAAERILGLSVDQINGRTSADPGWRAIGEDGAELPGDRHPSMIALQTGQPVTGAVMGVFNPQLGQTRWIRVSAIPLFEPDENRPGQVYATFNDITEIIESARALARARDELNIIHRDRAGQGTT